MLYGSIGAKVFWASSAVIVGVAGLAYCVTTPKLAGGPRAGA